MNEILKLSDLEIKNRVTNGLKKAIKRVNNKGEKINDIIETHIYLSLHDERVPGVITEKLKSEAKEFFKQANTIKLKKGDDLNYKITLIKKSPTLLNILPISTNNEEQNNEIIEDIKNIRHYKKINGKFKPLQPIIKFVTDCDKLEDYNKLIIENDKNKIRSEGIAKERKAIEEGEVKLSELKADDNAILNNEVARQKHKYKDEIEALREENEKLKQNQFQPSIKEYIKNKVRDGSYKLDKDDLHNMLTKDKNKGVITDENIDNVVKAIYLEGNRYVVKNKKRIAQLARLQGYNPNEYAKLPEETQKEVNDYIVEKFNDDLRRKNLKYILPKDKPRWQKAQVLFKVNPNLGRGAWSH